jgi:hypothetical protein
MSVVRLPLRVDCRVGPRESCTTRAESATREEERGERNANLGCSSHVSVMGRDCPTHH